MAAAVPDFPEFTREEQRAVIRFLFLKGKTGTEIHDELKSVLGESAMSRTCVYEWVNKFKAGRTSVKDEDRSGRRVSQ